jgi:hypothetical protein
MLMENTDLMAPFHFSSAVCSDVLLRFIVVDMSRVITCQEERIFTFRKNYNSLDPPEKSLSTIDRALQNISELFGAKHIMKTKSF